jgi:hypothetical protein
MMWLYRAFDRVEPFIAWFLLWAGVIGVILTLTEILPGIGDGWYGKIIASIGWVLVSKEGYNDLRGIVEDEIEEG